MLMSISDRWGRGSRPIVEGIGGQTFWDERSAGDDFVVGTKSNWFLSREAHSIVPSSGVLAVADGEGRNTVYWAGQGHTVIATDIAPPPENWTIRG